MCTIDHFLVLKVFKDLMVLRFTKIKFRTSNFRGGFLIRFVKLPGGGFLIKSGGHIYIYRERERDHLHVHTHNTYIYIHTHTYMFKRADSQTSLRPGAGRTPRSRGPSRSTIKLFTLLDLCVSSLRRGHANLICIVPILTDDPRRESALLAVL